MRQQFRQWLIEDAPTMTVCSRPSSSPIHRLTVTPVTTGTRVDGAVHSDRGAQI